MLLVFIADYTTTGGLVSVLPARQEAPGSMWHSCKLCSWGATMLHSVADFKPNKLYILLTAANILS